MKYLITTIAAVVLVGWGESQQAVPAPKAKPIARVVGAKAPDISIRKAASEGNIEAVKQHLAAGTDVNAKNDFGSTPLHSASAGTMVNGTGKRISTAGQKEIVELLIAKGADVNTIIGFDGRTPLHVAASYGHKEIAELLIAKGADVNAKSDGGWTPLRSIFRFRDQKETAELLITKGADVNAKDDDGETPIDKAIEYDYPEIADLLRKHGAKTGKELFAAGN